LLLPLFTEVNENEDENEQRVGRGLARLLSYKVTVKIAV
jgi:hypothetical protein